MKTSDAKRSKYGPKLRLLFAQAAGGEISMDNKLTFLMHAKEGFQTQHVNIRSCIGNIMTAEGTLRQIEELAKEKDVSYIEASQKMSPL